ncbi:hypothetical protein [Fimbriiglobus ruber]|uniref:Vegetative cell wall protein gp1 (Hydroxyproline-rich glycoprotein 1) n=1 Tax=Fimbriiglobus ruber TaxID=1908690 RepID=A0A225EAR5_9BACT|nr:hypothetical protein [Fimbriiglobus ruber]OWK47126.1 Vegetative cell wall protein gp1 precursor (Hydroxyproline-rich glycoprotein 1) [Fimbriiglobus ruber]
MDTHLLRTWLGLPPGPWPPDDRTLFGFTDIINPADAERRALDLMARLRPHQLVHPDLVTEGMNRLAQALIAITTIGPSPQPPAVDEDAIPATRLDLARPVVPADRAREPKAPYTPVPPSDPGTGTTPTTPVTKQRIPRAAPPVTFVTGPGSSLPSLTQQSGHTRVPPPAPAVDLGAVIIDPSEIPSPAANAPPPPPATEPILEAEAVAAEPAPKPRPPKPRKPPRRQKPVPAPEAQVFVEVPEPPLLPVRDVRPTEQDRRAAYRELAALRELLRAWDLLRPFFAYPSEALLTAGHVFEFLEGTTRLRTAWRNRELPPELASDVAPRVAAVVRQPLALAVFRSLTPSQRLTLAEEWATARAMIEADRVALRYGVAAAAQQAKPSDLSPRIAVWFGRNPEWLLGVATALALCLAALRQAMR